MALTILTIAEETCEEQAKLAAASLDSIIAVPPTGSRDGPIEKKPSRPEAGTGGDAINESVLDAQHRRAQSSPLAPEPSPITPPTTPEVIDVTSPRMAPGIGGFNIDPPPPRVRPFSGRVAIDDMPRRSLLNLELAGAPELSSLAPPTTPAIPGVAGPAMVPTANTVEREVAIAHTRDRLLFNPQNVRQPLVQIERTEQSSFVLYLLAIFAVIGVVLLAFRDEAGKQVSDISMAGTPLRDGLSKTSAQPPRLIIESQNGFANEPLPLGILLKDASGGETVMLAGLAAGTELSLGTSLGSAGWLVSAGDLEKTFVGAPKDFVGVMDATVSLQSADEQLLDSKVVRLEWTQKKEERLAPRPAPPRQAQVSQSLNPDEIATLLKVGEDFLKRGDIMSARVLFKRAAMAGNAQAALELGMTFDRTFLTQWGIRGFVSDAAQAREWYDRAIKLGSTEASRHLARLTGLPH